jgi:hypothetical protein
MSNINITTPLETVQYTYEKMTADTVFDRLHRFKANYVRIPEYLFLNKQGYKELNTIASGYMQKPENEPPLEIKMFMGLHVIILPTLPDNVLLLGVLVLEK